MRLRRGGEWTLSDEHHISHDAESPHVLLFPLVPLASQDLGAGIIKAAMESEYERELVENVAIYLRATEGVPSAFLH